MNIAMTILAFIGLIFICLVGVSVSAIVWFCIQERRKERRSNEKIDNK